MRSRLILSLLACVLAVTVALPAAASAKRIVPKGWLGTVATDPALLGFDGILTPEMNVMRASGVETMRFPVYWNRAQPYRTSNEVPTGEKGRFFTGWGGVPTDLTSIDLVVRRAAERGISVLPCVLASPRWAIAHKSLVIDGPKTTATYTNFLHTLVRRYGRGGSFWHAHPALPYRPIRRWQIWNEPDHQNFWARPWVTSYTKLVKASKKTLRKLDSGSKLVLGSLTGVSWYNLGRLYKAGIKGSYDVASIHPYTKEPKNVVTTLERDRRTMARYRDSKPVEVTELSWPASRGRVPKQRDVSFSTSEAGQAQRLKSALSLLVKNRKRLRIAGVYWFTWLSRYRGDLPWEYSGLRALTAQGTRVSKPALGTFRRNALYLEGR
jgi:hypothetical protein